jgi:hypothetical protein
VKSLRYADRYFLSYPNASHYDFQNWPLHVTRWNPADTRSLGLRPHEAGRTMYLSTIQLTKLFFDAMFNLSSLSISAASQPDKYRLLFSPDDYWKEKTGSPLVWSAPTVAWKDWIDEDRPRAKSVVNALHESWQWLRQNSDKAVEKYGKLAGVQNAAEAAALKKMLQAGAIFLDKWDPKIVDAQWRFLDLAKEAGIIKAVPAKDKHSLVLR